jgi:hypothetical protein
MSKPTTQTTPAEHLRTVTPDQMASVLALVEKAEQELQSLGVSAGPDQDKAALVEVAAQAGIPTSDAIAEREAEIMAGTGIDSEFFLSRSDDVDRDDINLNHSDTTAPPNSPALPAVDIGSFFALGDDINA